MSAEEKIIQDLVETLEKAVSDFNTGIPGIQKDLAKMVNDFVAKLDRNGDTITGNVANLKKIAAFKGQMENLLRKSGYLDSVNQFIETFYTVADLQHEYFSQVSADFEPSALLKEITKQSISGAIDSLTEAGLRSSLINPINNILVKNATTGGSFSELSGQLREFIVTTDSGDGALERYTKQITTDSLNQFSRQYTETITADLGLNWYMYTGSIIKTSRAWCKACVNKKYIHRSEFQKLIDGDFPEFKEEDGQIYEKTGLPEGMIAGTNVNNLVTYAGGWQCNHVFISVSDMAVPASIRNLFLNS